MQKESSSVRGLISFAYQSLNIHFAYLVRMALIVMVFIRYESSPDYLLGAIFMSWVIAQLANLSGAREGLSRYEVTNSKAFITHSNYTQQFSNPIAIKPI